MLSTLSKVISRRHELITCASRIKSPIPVAMAYALHRDHGYPRYITLRSGPTIRVRDWDELTTVWHVWVAEEYIVSKDCKTIIDLGANIGAFTLWAAARCPAATIYALEPYYTTYEALCENVGQNALGKRVRCKQCAIGNINGEVAFDATESKRSYCRRIVNEGDSAQQVRVPCLTLESLLDQCGLSEVDCIKMDIEGGEHVLFSVTSSNTLRRTKSWTMEYHDADRSRHIWKKLDTAGFMRIASKEGNWSGLVTYRRID